MAVLCILAVPIPAAAEDKTGEIRGVLSDPTGAVIPSAKQVLSIQGASSQSATSGRNGSFSFADLKPGKCSLEIDAKGFAQTTLEEIELQPGQMLQKDVTLQLPVDQQQVEVTGEATGVSTSPDSNASAIVIKGKDLDANPTISTSPRFVKKESRPELRPDMDCSIIDLNLTQYSKESPAFDLSMILILSYEAAHPTRAVQPAWIPARMEYSIGYRGRFLASMIIMKGNP